MALGFVRFLAPIVAARTQKAPAPTPPPPLAAVVAVSYLFLLLLLLLLIIIIISNIVIIGTIVFSYRQLHSLPVELHLLCQAGSDGAHRRLGSSAARSSWTLTQVAHIAVAGPHPRHTLRAANNREPEKRH
jgi:hypothetical protein